MSARWSLLAAVLLLAALVGVPVGAAAQTFPSDDAGRPAPWCSWLDTSVTPAQSIVCSNTHPLPSGPGAASIATDTLGYGRSFFMSATGSSTSITERITTVLFTDEINVLGYGITGANQAAVTNSSDGGRTWAPLTSLQLGAVNAPFHAGVTIGTSPRYVLAATGLATALDIFTSSNPSGGFVAATGGAGRNATSPVTFAIQGATVMAWAVGGGAANRAIACQSLDNGQTFQACVTVDAGNNSGFTGSGPKVTITSPSVNTWLAVANNGKVWRSVDNGATWTNVLTLTVAAPAPIKCLSATRCLVIDFIGFSEIPRLSTDGGATWTAQAAISANSGVAGAICLYGQNVVDFILRATFPSTLTGTTVPAYRSTDGGISWVGATATGGQPAFSGGSLDNVSDCTATATGRSAFVGFRTSSTGLYFGPTTANTVQVVGSNGLALAVDGNGNFTANQGSPQATSPNAWGVVPVQGPSLKNSQQTSAAATANTITIAAVASQRVHLRRIDASCNTATDTAATLTVTDGATVIWSLATAETVTSTGRTVVSWVPSLDGTTGAALTVTLAACTTGTSRLAVQADQF